MNFAFRFLARFVLGSLLIFGAGTARAGIPVIDVASLAQAIEQVLQSIEQISNQVRQIEQLQSQYEQLQSNYRAITGVRNLGAILDSPQLRNYIPADAAATMGNVQANGYASLSGSAKTLRDAQMVYNCLDLSGTQRRQCQASLSAPYQQKAFMSDAMTAAAGRVTQIQGLMAQINATTDQKAINEIQARIEAENAMLQHQQAAISMTRGLAEADDRIAESRAKEAQLQQSSSIRAPFRLRSAAMSTAADAALPPEARLPLSRKALKAIAESHTWDASVLELKARSESRAWAVAGGAVVLALLGFGMALFQATRPIAAPVPIVVDRTTGETIVVSSFDQDSVPKISALDQHSAAVFVRAYESYYFNLLKKDYDQVARMSTQEVFAPYSARFAGEGALQTKLGASQEHRVTVISVRMSSTTRPGRSGEAIVTFDKQLKSQSTSPMLTRYVATVRFEYRPQAMKRDVDRIENPFGFVVLSYRADPELLAPGTATPPAGQATTDGQGSGTS